MTSSASLPIASHPHFKSRHTAVESRCDFIQLGDSVSRPRLVVDGWAVGYRITFDGRRQLTNLYLPGEIIGVWRNTQPIFYHSVMSITRLSLMEFSSLPDSAVVQSECALIEQQQANSIFRLGCLNAYERMAHIFLEMGERVAIRGLGSRDAYYMPLTQELLADLVGISAVHVNRTLQQMRADKAIRLDNSQLTVTNFEALADLAHYQSLH